MEFFRFAQAVQEIENLVEERPRLRRRMLQDRCNPFEVYEDEQFKSRFRFNKETVCFILHLIGESLLKDTRGSPLTPAQQLFVTLRFYATGAFNKIIGDTMHVHESTVSRTVPRVSEAICRIKQHYIVFPAREELRKVKNEFAEISGDNFPGIVGCIDGTHIKISCPTINQAAAYINRKNFYSINCQVMCNGSMQITNIVARWPGSTHDSRIFRNSAIYDRFEAGEIDGHLLGDSGYPCRKYLLTPVRNPHALPEERYNRAHKRARNTVERTIGVWKRRFPCLSFGIRTSLQSAVNIIVATAVLHNIAMIRRDEELNGEIQHEEVPVPEVEDNNIPGNMWRRMIIQNHFS